MAGSGCRKESLFPCCSSELSVILNGVKDLLLFEKQMLHYVQHDNL